MTVRLRLCVVVGVMAVLALGIWVMDTLRGMSVSENERNSSRHLYSIGMAERVIYSDDLDGNGVNDFWTADVSQLHHLPGKGGLSIKGIEPSVANADSKPYRTTVPSVPVTGYWLRAVERDESGAPYNQQDGRNLKKFGFCAYPSAYQITGRHTFILNEKGLILMKDTGGHPIIQWPKDPSSENWRVLD